VILFLAHGPPSIGGSFSFGHSEICQFSPARHSLLVVFRCTRAAHFLNSLPLDDVRPVIRHRISHLLFSLKRRSRFILTEGRDCIPGWRLLEVRLFFRLPHSHRHDFPSWSGTPPSPSQPRIPMTPTLRHASSMPFGT